MFETLLEAYEPDSVPRGLLCGYLSTELQAGTVGCPGPAALPHAYRYWVDVRKICESRGRPLARCFLDFGEFREFWFISAGHELALFVLQKPPGGVST